jgi:predicted amidohydrolase YtcJ
MNFRILFTLILFVIMVSCQQKKEEADLIVHNAQVYTVDDGFTIQQAFAVKDGKFIAVGTSKAILGNYQSAQVIDADGKYIYPGFNDAHCHFYGFGTNLIKRADLTGTNSFEEVVERLQEHAEKYPSKWIEGRGWDQNDWIVKDFPTKILLDEAFPNNPVSLIRIDGHAAVVNSKALEMAGISSKTKIQGGEIIKINGNPTGLLIDNAMDLVSAVIPAPDEPFNKKALLIAQEKCFAVGLTSVADAGLEKNIVQLIEEMQNDGELKIRIYAMLSPTDENIEHFVKNGPYLKDRLTVRSIKLYADGALGSRGAKMIEPYSDDHGNSGLYMQKKEYFKKYCQLAFDNGYQVNTHAIGDGGNRFVLETYASYLNGKNDKRWRIEHAQIVHPDDFKLFGQYSVVPSVQPTHATSDMYWAEDRVGPHRIKGAYAYKKLLNENGWLPLGTDFPIESINPLYTYYAAVARKDLKGFPEDGYQIENALTREEALRGMTIWAAHACFEENQKGSIESGKYADFVIIEEDILNVELEIIPNLKIQSCFVGGENVLNVN